MSESDSYASLAEVEDLLCGIRDNFPDEEAKQRCIGYALQYLHKLKISDAEVHVCDRRFVSKEEWEEMTDEERKLT